MKYIVLGLILFLAALTTLSAVITPLQVIGPEQSKILPPGPDKFCVYQDLLYLVDNSSGLVKVWNISKNRIQKSDLIKLPPKVLVNDVTRDDKNIFLLDSKNSKIMIYDKDGQKVRDIATKGVPACAFKKAVRIQVNYQGIIYVLDQGRGVILRFTSEGLFSGQAAVPGAFSFTLGADQQLRVLQLQQKRYYITVLDHALETLSFTEINDLKYGRDDLIDLAVNDYGQYYFINGKKTQIGKLNQDLRLIPKSYFGSKNKTSNKTSFFEPSQIRVVSQKGADYVCVLDTRHTAIKIFTENDLSGLTKLERPMYQMRPVLSKTNVAPCLDFAVWDSLSYVLSDGTMPNRKTSRQISCRDTNDKKKFNIFAASFKSEGVKSFDALTVYKNRLYVLDKAAHRVHIFNSLDGSYEESFGDKGKYDGAMKNPGSIVADLRGNVYIADTGNFRISVWTEYGAFQENINLKKDKLQPRQLRVDNYFMYVLANKGELYKSRLDDIQRDRITIASLPRISSFDLLEDSRVAIVKGDIQELVILSVDSTKPARSSTGRVCLGYKVDSRYFASSPSAEYPFFSDIFQIRYNSRDRILYISDSKVKTSRTLKFIAPPLIPQYVAVDINDKLQTVILWDQGDGIRRWSVNSYTDTGDTLTYMTSEPVYTVQKPQDTIRYYQIAAYSDDNKLGSYTDPVIDHFSFARYLSETQNYLEAIKILEQMQDEHYMAKAVDELYRNYNELSDQYLKAGEYEQALLALETASLQKGLSSDIIEKTVLIYKLMGTYKAGISFLNKLETASAPEWIKQRISLYNLDKDYDNVIIQAEYYTRYHGDDQEVLSFLAQAFEEKAQYVEALDYTRKAAILNTTFTDQMKIADLLLKLANYDEAIVHLNRMLTIYEDERDGIYNMLGKSYFGKGDWGQAADNLENALIINPESAEYHLNLAMTYDKDRKPQEAQVHFQESWRLNPKDFDTGVAFARFLQRNNLGSDALTVIDQIMTFATDEQKDGQFHSLYGDLLTQNGRYDEAVAELALAVDLFPDNDGLYEMYQQSLQTRERENKFRNPLEIKEVKFDALYPSMQQYYRDHPIGTVTIYNTRNTTINNVKLTVIIEDITDSWINIPVARVQPNEIVDVNIFAPINKNIFAVSKDSNRDINTEVRIEYFFEDEGKSHKEIRRLQVLRIQAMDWSNRKQLGCFVNPNDENLRAFVVGVVLPTYNQIELPKTSRNLVYAAQLYDFYHANEVRYVPDPSSSNSSGVSNDYIQFPYQTLELKRGDCDDLLVLLASSLSVAGIETGFLDVPGHVILVVDSGLTSTDIMQSGFDINHFIYRNNKYWIPVETTLLGKNNFVDSWLYAIESYRDIYNREQIFPDLIEFSQSHRIYPPASHTGVILSASFTRAEQARELFNRDIANIMLLNQITVEKDFIRANKQYPDNLDLLLQYALWSFDHGKLQQAENLLAQILQAEPSNFAALINLGNLHLEKGEYDKARSRYVEALKANFETDKVNLNLCVLEYRRSNLERAREYYNKIVDKDILYKISPQMYSDLVGKGE